MYRNRIPRCENGNDETSLGEGYGNGEAVGVVVGEM